MNDYGLREQIRKELRDFDNPKMGKNPNYQNLNYMSSLETKYAKPEAELRNFAISKAHKGTTKYG